jgi:hypothetical protein
MKYCFDGFIRDMECMLNNLRGEYGKEWYFEQIERIS